MRHRKKGSTLNRTTAHRKALLSNLATEVIRHDRIQTTLAKAKEVRPLVEKMVTRAKTGTLHARRQALRVIRDRTVVKKLFDELGPLYESRPGGYTRIIKLGYRLGDNAALSIIELVDREQTPVERKKAASREKAAAREETPAETPAAESKSAKAGAEAKAAADAEAASEVEAESEEPVETEGKKRSRRAKKTPGRSRGRQPAVEKNKAAPTGAQKDEEAEPAGKDAAGEGEEKTGGS